MKKLNSNQTTKLFNNDCLKAMDKLIEDGVVVDAIITDPPYNISKKNNFSTMKSAKRSGIDFGEWDKECDLFSWIKVGDRLLKNGGNIIIFNSFLNIGNIARYLGNMNYSIKDLIRWIKPNPMPRNTKRRFVSDYEFAIWCVKGNKKWVFNQLDKPYMRPEIISPRPMGNEKVDHPTQKPILLMNKLVRIFTNEGDLVLDPFMGSGSTGIACKNLNRRFIGVELDKKYFDIANKRIFKEK